MIARGVAKAGLCTLAVLLLGVWGSPVPGSALALTDYEFLEEPVSGEVDVRAQIEAAEGWPADSLARIVFCYMDEGDHLYLEVSADGLRLGKVQDGAVEVLATADPRREAEDGSACGIIIKRRSWAIRVLWNGRVALTAYEAFAPGEMIGSADRHIEVRDLHAQPIGEMMFSDGFERPPGESSPWEVFLGTWEVAVPDTRNKKVDPTRSANPFSYIATGEKALACVAQSSFWDSYEAGVAVKATDGAVGLAFYVQDKDNYYLLRGRTSAPLAEDVPVGPQGSIALVRVAGGQETLLAQEPCDLLGGQWYRLSIRSSGGHLDGMLNGQIIVQGHDEAFGQGNIGLYTDGCSKAQFDGVELAPYGVFRDAYKAAPTLPLAKSAGFWTVQNGVLRGRGSPRKGAGIALTGSAHWSDYSFAADIRSLTAPAIGMYFGVAGPQDYYLFRWGREREGGREQVQELWCIEGGKAQCLGRRPGRLNPRKIYRVQALTDRSYIAITVDGERVLQAAHVSRRDSGPGRGRVGYHVEGGPRAIAVFDNLHVQFHRPPDKPKAVTAQFAKEDTMADWARPAASWTALGNGLHAYKLPVWGDFDIHVDLPPLAPASISCSIGLKVAQTTEALAAAAPCLTVATQKGSAGLKPAGGDQDAAATSDEDAPVLELERRGSRIIASLDGKPFACAQAVPGSEAPAVGIEIKAGRPSTNDIRLTSPHIIDETFTSAPTGWAAGAGDWQISDRWHCQPQWSWFCGKEAESPLLWYRSSFAGDMVAEFWAAIMMDLKDGAHYKHPSDLNGIICGDGKQLCSGYSFVFAGDNNTTTRILREGKSVAETAAFKIGSKNEYHRHWYHCRLEKSGGRLTYYVDDKKALEYDDPNPLSEGHVGIWTHQGNGILVSRARIAFKQAKAGGPQDGDAPE